MSEACFLASPLPTGPVAPGLWALRDAFVNAYLLETGTGFVAIDAGWRPTRIRRALWQLGLDPAKVRTVLLSHAHWDHARGLPAFPTAEIHQGPVPPEGRLLELGTRRIHILPCPGHTVDSVAILVDGRWLFTGDALRLKNGIARPNFAGFNPDNRTLKASLLRLAELEGLEALLTAHWGASWEPAAAFNHGKKPA